MVNGDSGISVEHTSSIAEVVRTGFLEGSRRVLPNKEPNMGTRVSINDPTVLSFEYFDQFSGTRVETQITIPTEAPETGIYAARINGDRELKQSPDKIGAAAAQEFKRIYTQAVRGI